MKAINQISRNHSVQSVETGAAALIALASCAPAAGLSRLAECAGMAPAKLHRYLQALIASGFACQDAATGRYGLGPAALTVGLAALAGIEPMQTAAPHLAVLRDETGLACLFAVWSNHGATVVRVLEPPGTVTVVTRLGSVLPLLTSATGRIFLAYLPDAATCALLAAERRKMPRDKTMDSSQLAAIRESGWCTVHGSLLAGIDAAAAPVFDAGRDIAGVVTILGPASATDLSATGTALTALRRAAAAVTRALGGAAAEPITLLTRPKR